MDIEFLFFSSDVRAEAVSGTITMEFDLSAHGHDKETQ